MELAQAIGILAGFLGVCYVMGNILVDRYFKKHDNLEELKQRYTNATIAEIKHSIKEMRDDLNVSIEKINELVTKVNVLCTKSDTHKENLERLINIIKKLSEKTDARLKDIEDSELVKLDHDHYVLRKKNGK